MSHLKELGLVMLVAPVFVMFLVAEKVGAVGIATWCACTVLQLLGVDE